MQSFFASAGYSDKKTLIKINATSGYENTYQAWWGVPKAKLENDLEGMQRYLDHWLYTQAEYDHMLASNNRTYNYYVYDNAVDDYTQSHYQAFVSRKLSPYLKLNMAFNYTKGKGYYENFDYGYVANDDKIQRKWLDNELYVLTYSLDYLKDNFKATLGGSWQDYYGKHYGEIIWQRNAGNSQIRDRWYYNTGDKQDFNIYGKFEYLFFDQFNAYLDLQYRAIYYAMLGVDDDQTNLGQKNDYLFFNPKFGLNYNFRENQNFYFTYGIANREPARADFKDRAESTPPKHETLMDYELGYTIAGSNAKLNVNLYYMDYDNQLVKTGEINSVGATIMTNVAESYRRGIEFVGGVRFSKMISWEANATFSQNKIKNYTEFTDNWDDGTQNEIVIGETNISFSPDIIASSQLVFTPVKGLELAFISKYVGEQYIDNSSAQDRMLDAYFVNSFRINYHIKTKFIEGIDFQLLVNNAFGEEYESNAWVYRYFYENEYHNMDGYFPQAGINILAGIVLNF